MSYSPTNPDQFQKIRIKARAEDQFGIRHIDILVNGKRVKMCLDKTCEYVAGPFQPGVVTFAAKTYDLAGNPAFTGYKKIKIKQKAAPPRAGPSKPKGGVVIEGQITGQRQYVKEVALYDKDLKKLIATTPVSDGRYKFKNLGKGVYWVTPLPGGKFDLSVAPSKKRLECKANSDYSADFHVKGITEG